MNYSLIATTYNDEKEIEAYFENILCQIMLPYEIVIADGGSTDNTINVIKKYQEISKVPIILLCGRRLNIAEGYNEAIKNASCKYIGITGVGNFYDKKYFEYLAKSMQQNNSDVEYGVVCAYGKGRFVSGYEKAFLDKYRVPSNHGCLIKREIFEEIGLFLTNYIYAGEDEEFFQRVMNKGYICHFCENSRVYWEVPQNCRELNKQISNYMIGSMQIYSATRYLWSIKYSIIFTAIFCSSFFYHWMIIAVMAIFIIFMVKGGDFFVAFLKYYYHITKTILLFRNIKFLKKKYQVSKSGIYRTKGKD